MLPDRAAMTNVYVLLLFYLYVIKNLNLRQASLCDNHVTTIYWGVDHSYNLPV